MNYGMNNFCDSTSASTQCKGGSVVCCVMNCLHNQYMSEHVYLYMLQGMLEMKQKGS